MFRSLLCAFAIVIGVFLLHKYDCYVSGCSTEFSDENSHRTLIYTD